ncbi:Mba1p NDAI_0C05610 [Naumovozyma dairenensis CBS 421]|uniref:Uncharacterized protein n=1 Tax=Naumovozyma dairenensis (strain ATCC 10597 / BCRC 20456 / CBS 421 / NBRC 0211 / NRRL Y-12639) TaxID=1071378 RepID=G0W8V9_NAUDC|nr:hypothetical protein NDAI_0C05610 [Naumovozyma dairenensis CBS 421]CCD24220.1 hypothetical protein NDAI_0C05610 [Naumovozyma dairenensis CBS 421]
MLTRRLLLRPLTYRSSPISLNRYLSTSRVRLADDENTEAAVEKPKEIDPRVIGIANDIYIPASYKNYPNPIFHPVTCFNALIRRVYYFGQNTVNVALFRFQAGIKPNFLLWKNNAIEIYVQVNKAFADRKVNIIKPLTSIWVDEALEARVKQLPKAIKLNWKLVKFNEVPKLMNVQPMMIPGRPLEFVQLVYKFNTKQELIKYDKKTDLTENITRDVVDYISFFCNSTTGDMTIMGSVFENKPDDKLPKRVLSDDNKGAIRNMKIHGDLYRLNPNEKNL